MNETTASASLAAAWAADPQGLVVGILVSVMMLIWVYVWKALALWRAARGGDKIWFGLLLIMGFATYGLVDMAYYVYISKIDWMSLLGKVGVKVKSEPVAKTEPAESAKKHKKVAKSAKNSKSRKS